MSAKPSPRKRKRRLRNWAETIEDWREQNTDRSMHCDPHRLGIPDEPLLWWETDVSRKRRMIPGMAK